MTNDKVVSRATLIYGACMIIGISFLFSANVYRQEFNGELIRSDVHTKTSCDTICDNEGKNCRTSCTNRYYVHQIFRKEPDSDSLSTCTVERPRLYYFKGDADNFVSRTKLGTRRRLYESLLSHGTCFDDKIKTTWNKLGAALVIIPNIILLLRLCFSAIRDSDDEFKKIPKDCEKI